jgi:adenylyl- and sulfurtransferase ThiI
MKAIALLSGGLDSALAVRIILEQGIEVEALKFTSIFCNCDNNGKCYSEEIGKEFNIPVRTMFKWHDVNDRKSVRVINSGKDAFAHMFI